MTSKPHPKITQTQKIMDNNAVIPFATFRSLCNEHIMTSRLTAESRYGIRAESVDRVIIKVNLSTSDSEYFKNKTTEAKTLERAMP